MIVLEIRETYTEVGTEKERPLTKFTADGVPLPGERIYVDGESYRVIDREWSFSTREAGGVTDLTVVILRVK